MGTSKSTEAANTFPIKETAKEKEDNIDDDDDDDDDLIGPPIPTALIPDDSVKKASKAETDGDGDDLSEEETEEVSSFLI